MSMTPVHGGGAIALAIAIVLGAFASEDGSTITAATFAASSLLDFRLAFLGAFIGLWVGDLGIYALTCRIGPPIVHHRWFKGWFTKEKYKVSDSKGKDGWLSLALSRFFPGTRLPAYVSTTEKVSTFHTQIVNGRVWIDPKPNPPGTRVEPSRIADA